MGRLFTFSCWSLDFSPDTDSMIVPVWVEFHGLPTNFFFEAMIMSIAGSIGTILQIDQDTLLLSRTNVARVYVLMDVSQQFPEQVWGHRLG